MRVILTVLALLVLLFALAHAAAMSERWPRPSADRLLGEIATACRFGCACLVAICLLLLRPPPEPLEPEPPEAEPPDRKARDPKPLRQRIADRTREA